VKGGKIGLRRSGRGQDLLILELIHNVAMQQRRLSVFAVLASARARQRPLVGNVRIGVIIPGNTEKHARRDLRTDDRSARSALRVGLTASRLRILPGSEHLESCCSSIIFSASLGGFRSIALLGRMPSALVTSQTSIRKSANCRSASHRRKAGHHFGAGDLRPATITLIRRRPRRSRTWTLLQT